MTETKPLTYSVRARRLDALGSEASCKEARIDYEIVVDTDEPERKLELLHENVRRYGTVYNTVAPGPALAETLRRRVTGD